MKVARSQAVGWRVEGTLLTVALGMLLGSPSAEAQSDEEFWSSALNELAVHRGGRERTLGAVSEDLSEEQKVALGEWVVFSESNDLHVILPSKADAVIFGAADLDDLEEAAETLDDTWELFIALRPAEALDEEPRTSVFFLFDRDAHASAVWPALLDELAVRGQLIPQAVNALRSDPTSLTQRNERLVLQATYDMAGDASAGDDEFRMHNELAHKLVWMMLRERFGRLPPNVEWGLGYVAEQRLFRSIFQFNHTGFVAVTDHYKWPARTREMVLSDRKRDGIDFGKRMLNGAATGAPLRPQMQSWGVLDFMLNKQPERLVPMLVSLAELHGEGDPYGVQPAYSGNSEAAAAVIRQSLSEVSLKDLERHLKRVK